MKRIMLLCLSVLLLIGLVGCSSTAPVPTAAATAEPAVSATPDVEPDPGVSGDPAGQETADPGSAGVEVPVPSPTPAGPIELPIGTPILVENKAEITVKSHVFQKRPKSGRYYLRPDMTEDETCLVIYFQYKNLGSDEVDDWMSDYVEGLSCADLVFDGKYMYTPDVWVPNEIAPLSTGPVIFYYVIPEIVRDGQEPLTTMVTIGKTQYVLTLR
ncbi:MAG: hypothetical protein IJP30_03705 [Clostridia bacterium]|nr:hypothetical protein [Clostridia bacterium]